MIFGLARLTFFSAPVCPAPLVGFLPGEGLLKMSNLEKMEIEMVVAASKAERGSAFGSRDGRRGTNASMKLLLKLLLTVLLVALAMLLK
jgi:hypothetical protein